MLNSIGNYKNRPRTVAFYGRVSTEHEQQLSALGNQMDWYMDLAARNPNWTVVAQYIDEGITGTQMKKRPSFMQMMEHAKAQHFDLIVTRELSRFARNTVDALNSIRELKQYGVEVYFVNDGIWTMDGDGEVRLTIMASIAQDESRKTSERVKAGQKISREKGVLYGNGNILGYDRVGGTYVVNEEQAATVRRIYELYAAGNGETVVANILMAEGRKDGGGGCTWTASKVSRVLRKPTYKGYITYNKSHVEDFLNHNRINHDEQDYVVVKGDFEPIVSEELWSVCNEIRSKRASYVKDNHGRSHKFGVSNPQNKWTKILFCDCGARFQIEGLDKMRNENKNMRFICSATKKISKRKETHYGIPCPNPNASEWKLELMAKVVFRTVWEERGKDVLKVVRAVNEYLNQKEPSAEYEKLKTQQEKLIGDFTVLMQSLAEKKITVDEFVARRDEIDAQIAEIGKAISEQPTTTDAIMKFDFEKIEAALCETIGYPDGKIDAEILDRYVVRIIKSNNRYVWLLSLAERVEPKKERNDCKNFQITTYKSGAVYKTGQQPKEPNEVPEVDFSRGWSGEFLLNANRHKRERQMERLFSAETAVRNEPIPLVRIEIDFKQAYQYQADRGMGIHPGRWQNLEVEVYLV